MLCCARHISDAQGYIISDGPGVIGSYGFCNIRSPCPDDPPRADQIWACIPARSSHRPALFSHLMDFSVVSVTDCAAPLFYDEAKITHMQYKIKTNYKIEFLIKISLYSDKHSWVILLLKFKWSNIFLKRVLKKALKENTEKSVCQLTVYK